MAAALSFAEDLVRDTFEPYQKLLEQHLIEKDLENDGLVSAFEYQAALEAEETQTLLNRQNGILADFDVDQIDSREQALAFWNKAYNYFMIEQILTELEDGELVDSVWDYGGRYNPFRDFIKAHADDHLIEKIEGTDRIHHIDYDGSLNKPANFSEFE